MSARIVEVGSRNYTQVECLDSPGAGNACHKYRVSRVLPAGEPDDGDIFTTVNFQNGPIKESGINGCHNEDLIAIVIDRLCGFQSGEYKCRENALALTKLEEALHWLGSRTADRQRRGVEGTHTL
jgi:hypothetical protein